MRLRVATGVLRSACLIGLVVVGVSDGAAEPDRRFRRGFQLFAKPIGAITINRVYCGIDARGNICTDSTSNFNINGGFWPRGTANDYVFNSGIQLAGVIGSDGGPWAGDTTGAFFFDAAGGRNSGREVRPLYNGADLGDRADWPDAARVPCNQLMTSACTDPALGGAAQDAAADIYSPVLQGRSNASQGDIWTVAWDGDPSLNPGARLHPLGVVLETRGLGWNYPKGNEDIIYFVTTFYNVTARTNVACGGCYDGVRPAMRDILLEQAEEFHALNNAAFGVILPEGGYTIDPLFAAYSADMDVRGANNNYSTVNLPFALGSTYHTAFEEASGWTFDPGIFEAPFFKGTGFAGIKYLRSPTGKGEIHLFATPTNAGQTVPFGDPLDGKQLFRYLSGNLNPLAGDDACNTGDPRQTHVCFVWNGGAADLRFFQSSTPLSLAPGAFGSIVVAYIFAAPVAGVCTAPCNARPGDVLAVSDPARAGDPAQVPDDQKLAGYIGWSDFNANGEVDQEEFDVVPGSLLGKALTAQAVFDAKFLLPFSPDAPDFFLIPGDDQVTVMWRPSPTEMDGDPYFQLASQALVGGVINPLYDPNFREFDVEGYRVYRGRVNTPSDLTLIAQLDYAGTIIRDYGGQVNPVPLCAPELNLVIDCAAPYILAEFQPGIQRTVFAPIELQQISGSNPVNTLNQVRFGERVLLADGSALLLVTDTAIVGSTGSCAPNLCPPLRDNGVPFFFVDRNVRNNFRYFYTVTAFDFNSWQSGPTNLESARITKAVTPTKPATNYTTGAEPGPTAMFGRGTQLDPTAPVPPLDPGTGVWGGPMPPADGWDIQIAEFISTVMPTSGTFNARLDSVRLGNAWGDPDPNIYFWTGIVNPPVVFTLATLQPFLDDNAETFKSLTYPAATTDASLAGRYGGDGGYFIQGQTSISQPGIYVTNGTGRSSSLAFSDGAQFESDWDGSFYDGPRWFEGTESFANPTGGFCSPNCTVSNWNNAGNLAGITSIHQPASYTTMNFSFREFQGAMGGASRAADVEVHWGAAGMVDSVVDVTHNVLVPFKSGAFRNPQGTLVDAGVGLSWGFLNTAGQASGGEFNNDPSNVSVWDFVCLNPFWVDTHLRAPCSLSPGAGDDPMFLESTAAISNLGYVTTSFQSSAPARTAPGFAMWMNGNIFFFETGSLPAAGTVWTMRDHIGGIYGGKGTGVDQVTVVNDAGPYGFHGFTRPMTAAGVELEGSFAAVNQINAPTANDIANVHPVPDPYYITNEYEVSSTDNRIEFVNLPQQAIIRIYSSSGILVDLIEHNSSQAGGSASWSVRNRNDQAVASGVYFYHVEANDQRRVGRMTIVRFAE